MDRQLWMVIFGVAAIVLYTASWVFQIMEYPGKNLLRVGAAIPFLIGAGILLYDRWKRNSYHKPKKKNDWSDILGEEEENN
jgi:hypothetical protein